ncbi:MAG: hypothetical protein EOM20_06540 [Spartobacteria bacterium]|nr:hypothetical protein [Spartobacteria bacterium]
MSNTLERLVDVQECDRKIARLAREAQDIPKRKQEIDNRLNAHRKALEDARNDLQKKRADSRELEVEVDSFKQKIIKFREQQFQTKKNEEYRALEHEVELTEKKIREVEDRELVLMEEIEQLNRRIAEMASELKQEEALIGQDTEILDKRAQEIEVEITHMQRERTGLVEGIDTGWLRRYERILHHVGDFAMVPVEKNSCGGCHMNLPPQLINNAKRADDLTLCSFCGRILYHRH